MSADLIAEARVREIVRDEINLQSARSDRTVELLIRSGLASETPESLAEVFRELAELSALSPPVPRGCRDVG